MPPAPKKGRTFRTQSEFAQWLRKNHAAKAELWMCLFKVHASHRGIGYREAVDESLCWGWIDGVRYSLDADSFTQRFTPRKAKSIWSTVNIKRFKELQAEGRVTASGLAAFNRWDGKRAPYSFENRPRKLSPDYIKRFKANVVAWTFFTSQAPWYQRVSTWLVMEGKKPETRDKRFAQLVAASASGRRINQLVPKSKR
ncbi:MAG TPA: YdeI/OmpD-associated family protein [Gemmatimonadaceae bacterium]